MFAVFSLFLLSKIILNVRIVHYGFYLALPAVVMTIVVTAWLLPKLVSKSSVAATTPLLPLVIVILALSLRYVLHSHAVYEQKTFLIGADADRIIASAPEADPRTLPVAEAITWIQNNMDHDDTFAVFPDGVMLNYLTRHSSTLRYINFMPPEVFAAGEENILQEIQNSPPNYIVLVDKNMTEYGLELFGQDQRYGKLIMDWVRTRYHTVATFGHPPLQSERFGIEILQRDD